MDLLKKLLLYLIVVNKYFEVQFRHIAHKPVVPHGHFHCVTALKILGHTTWGYLKLRLPACQTKNFGKVHQNPVLKFFVLLVGVDPGVSFLKNYLFLD